MLEPWAFESFLTLIHIPYCRYCSLPLSPHLTFLPPFATPRVAQRLLLALLKDDLLVISRTLCIAGDRTQIHPI